MPTGLIGVIAVDAGSDHTLALKSDGTVAVWGDDAAGQLNVPARADGSNRDCGRRPAHAGLEIQRDPSWRGDNNIYGALNVPAGLTGVIAIAGGGTHSVALKSNGTVVAWGNNSQGQTNAPTGLTGVTAIAAGQSHTVALKSDGTVVAWGSNSSGQSSVPAGLNRVLKIAAGSEFTLAVQQTDFYVDATTGNQSTGTGTPAAPYRTVTKALAQASVRAVYVKAGNYGTDRPRITNRVRLINWGNTGLARIGKP